MFQATGNESGVRLSDVLPECRLIGGTNDRVTSCCSDWHQCQPGDLFVAIDSPNRDGHQDAQSAIDQGAKAIVTERLLPISAPQFVVPDTRDAFGKICQALAGNPSDDLKVIAITGTYGKTITAHLMHEVFEEAGVPTGLISGRRRVLSSRHTVQSFDGPLIREITQTDDLDPEEQTSNESKSPSAVSSTPDTTDECLPPTLMALSMAEAAANGCQLLVTEASSQSLAQRHWSGITLDSVVYTNLTSDHLDYHGTESNYLKAKKRMIDQLPPEGLCVFDADDPSTCELLEEIDRPALSISLEERGEINAYLIERHVSEQTFLIHAGDDSIVIRTKMIGDAVIRSALLVTAVALSKGIPLTTIARGLERVDYVPGRRERIECGQTFGVFVDAARSPVQVRETLKTLRSVCAGKLICVYAARPDRPKSERSQLGHTIEKFSDLGIITSDNPGLENPLEIAHQLLDGYKRPGRDHLIPDRAEAIRYAIESAEESDVVVIVGKGDEQIQRIGGTNWYFDDREVCRRVLYGDSPSRFDDEQPPEIFRIDDYR